MRIKRFNENNIEVDPFGEEEWDDSDKIYYSICTGIEKGCFVVKVEKVYLNSMKKYPTNYRNDDIMYDVELMGGIKITIIVFFNKVSIGDLIKKVPDQYSRDYNRFIPEMITHVLKDDKFLIQEKYMTIDEIKKLANDIYDLCSSNTIHRVERDIKYAEEKISDMKLSIDKMRNEKLIKYDIKDIKSIKPVRNIFLG